MVGESLQEHGILFFAARSVLALPWHVRSDCNPPVVEPLLGGAGMVTAHLCTRVPACARVCTCVPALPVGQREPASRTGRDSGWCGTALLHQALAALGGPSGAQRCRRAPGLQRHRLSLQEPSEAFWGCFSALLYFIFPQVSLCQGSSAWCPVPCAGLGAIHGQGAAFQGAPGSTERFSFSILGEE